MPDGDLRQLAEVEEISIGFTRPDGSTGSTPVWVVQAGDAIFVRSIRGRRGGWYRRLRANPDGEVGQAGDRSMGREPELVHGRPCDWPWVAAGPIPGVRPGVPQPPREVVSAAPRVPFHKIVEWDATAGQFAYDPNYDQKQPDWT